jgi:two-component system OmpR family sensor kinase
MSRRVVAIAIGIIILVWLPLLLVKTGIVVNLLFLGHYQADLMALMFLSGIAGTLLIVLGLGLIVWRRALIRKARLAEKSQQAAARRDFLRRLDHEMKNPLTTIRLGLLNIQQTLTVDQQSSLTRIVQQTHRMQRLVEDLRYLTEIEEYPLECTAVDLPTVLENAIDLVCSDPERQGRTIELHIQKIPWPLPDVYGDPELLFIVFRNLLDNAVKYTAPEGKVMIRTSEHDQMALIEVIDTGIGIAPEDLNHVFDDLYRGQNARGIAGNGLGLALVQRIVQLHTGKIEINSRRDRGTVLKVWLPLISTRGTVG